MIKIFKARSIFESREHNLEAVNARSDEDLTPSLHWCFCWKKRLVSAPSTDDASRVQPSEPIKAKTVCAHQRRAAISQRKESAGDIIKSSYVVASRRLPSPACFFYKDNRILKAQVSTHGSSLLCRRLEGVETLPRGLQCWPFIGFGPSPCACL